MPAPCHVPPTRDSFAFAPDPSLLFRTMLSTEAKTALHSYLKANDPSTLTPRIIRRAVEKELGLTGRPVLSAARSIALQTALEAEHDDWPLAEGDMDEHKSEINQIAKGVFEACPHLIRARAPSDSCAHCESRHPCVAGFRRA